MLNGISNDMIGRTNLGSA